MAPIGAKLWENAFQMIPDISFFDAGKKKPATIFVGNQPTACFGGAMIFWTSLTDPSRKMTPDEIIFGSLRLLAEG